MLYSLVQFTKNYVDYNTSELVELASLFKPISLNKNEVVLINKEPLSDIFFLEQGVLKSYLENDEKIYFEKFYFNPIFFSDLNALVNKKKSQINFVAIKNSDLFKANFEDIINLTESSKKHNLFFKKIFEDDYMFNKYNLIYKN
ncbi:MAG: hypothetical protein ACOVQR_08000 [Flavobacterium sp.]|jgi:hypothetical protein|uniref:hypothetical protein n=1 Tax=Flavobacterium sp. TaxID=239 RepID=UPI003BA6C856